MILSHIERQVDRLKADFGLTPIIACELEFYLQGASQCATLDKFWTDVPRVCESLSAPLFKHEKETGQEQFEIALRPALALKAAADILATKDILSMFAKHHDMVANFGAKPFADEPGSGLHVHVHLQDSSGKNLFYKDDERMSDPLRFSIAGLLAALPRTMSVFAPSEASYARFVGKTNAPTTISWGANNRTTAIRLPDAAHDKKRIEHRVAGADAYPISVIAAMLQAMHEGLTQRQEPPAQIYGDASLEQYQLPSLPKTLEEALALRAAS
ncbi:MAG: hypothetical protein SFT92_05585 [Rickettsiales bacterium]|nr:hypothetical protein [Rickettsiales bacterium]